VTRTDRGADFFLIRVVGEPFGGDLFIGVGVVPPFQRTAKDRLSPSGQAPQGRTCRSGVHVTALLRIGRTAGLGSATGGEREEHAPRGQDGQGLSKSAWFHLIPHTSLSE